jgi:hypothetical protein
MGTWITLMYATVHARLCQSSLCALWAVNRILAHLESRLVVCGDAGHSDQ